MNVIDVYETEKHRYMKISEILGNRQIVWRSTESVVRYTVTDIQKGVNKKQANTEIENNEIERYQLKERNIL